MKKKLILIQSCSDIITNSSSEVFVMKANDTFDAMYNELSERERSDFDLIRTEEDLKQFLTSQLDNWYDMEDWDELVEFNPLKILASDFSYFRDEFAKIGVTSEKLVELCLPAYRGLIGKAILVGEDNYVWHSETVKNFIHEASKNDLIEKNYRV